MFGWISKQSASVRKIARKVLGGVTALAVGGGVVFGAESLDVAQNGDPIEMIAAGIALLVYDRVRNGLKAYVEPARTPTDHTVANPS